jgi:hypothetical protein
MGCGTSAPVPLPRDSVCAAGGTSAGTVHGWHNEQKLSAGGDTEEVRTAAPVAHRRPIGTGDPGHPVIDPSVAKLVESFVVGAVAGDGDALWSLLGDELRQQLGSEARQQDPPLPPQEWCILKYRWHWAENRGSYLSTVVQSFDGHMCGLRTRFSAGPASTVDYRDIFWVNDGAITATSTQCLLTHEQRQSVARGLVSCAAGGEAQQVWPSMAPCMQRHYEQEGASRGRPVSGEELCRQQHDWQHARGVFEGQKMVSYDPGTSTAVTHVYFTQGTVRQVAYKETFVLAPGMCTARRTDNLATDWQKKQAAKGIFCAIVERDSAVVWAGLSPTLQASYTDAGDKQEPMLDGAARCMQVHDWETTRGRCTAVEIDSFDGKCVTIASLFDTHGVASIGYRDSFWMSSCLVTARSSTCLFSQDQAEELCAAIATAAALDQAPEPYSYLEDSVAAAVAAPSIAGISRGRAWIYSISSLGLREQMDADARDIDVGMRGVQLCCSRFKWDARCRGGAPGTVPGFRGFDIVSCVSTPGQIDAFTATVHHRWDCGVTHTLMMVDEMVVVAGNLDACNRLEHLDVMSLRSPLPHPSEMALVTRVCRGVHVEASFVEMSKPDGAVSRSSTETVENFMSLVGQGQIKQAWDTLSMRGRQKYPDFAAFEHQLDFLGPRVLEVGTKYEHIMRLHEGGKRGSSMVSARVVDWDAVHNTARVHSLWEPTQAIYEDSISVCFSDGLVSEFVPLGIATQASVQDGADADFRLRWLIYAPRLPSYEDSVMSQAGCEVALSTSAPNAVVEDVHGLHKLVAGRILRSHLPHVRVRHSIANLQEVRLCMRDAIPAGFGSVACNVPSLTPLERRLCLRDTSFAFVQMQAFLQSRDGMRHESEPDFMYAVRSRQLLYEAFISSDTDATVEASGGDPIKSALVSVFKSAGDKNSDSLSALGRADTYTTALRLNGIPARVLLSTSMAEAAAAGEYHYTCTVFVDAVGWVSADPATPHPSTFGMSLGDHVVMAVKPSTDSVLADVAILRPGFEAQSFVDRMCAQYDVGENGGLDTAEVETMLAEAIGVTPGSEYVKRAVDGLSRTDSNGCQARTISYEKLKQAVQHDGVFKHLFAGMTVGHLPVGIRGSLNPKQDSFHVDLLACDGQSRGLAISESGIRTAVLVNMSIR